MKNIRVLIAKLAEPVNGQDEGAAPPSTAPSAFAGRQTKGDSTLG